MSPDFTEAPYRIKSKVMKSFLFKTKVVFVLFFLPSIAQTKSNLLFEGFYKLDLSSKHVGYYIIRVEGDNEKKEILYKSFLKTNDLGGNLNEGLQAKSTLQLKPISYRYTLLQGQINKTIDAQVTNKEMFLKITEGKKLLTQKVKLEDRMFFSSFLTYVLLASPSGLKVNQKYDYHAVSEEDGKIETGNAFVTAEEKYNELPAYKVLNQFKGQKFVNYLAMNGESLFALVPDRQFSARLVKTLDEARGNIHIDEKTLKLVFDTIPEGKQNILYYKDKKPASVFKTK